LKADQVQQEVAVSTREPEPPKTNSKQEEPGQSVPAPTVNSHTLDMLRALTAVQQIMTELKGAVSEEAMIFAITRNCKKLNEGKWQIEFIGPSKS
jgi:hypothetical protein